MDVATYDRSNVDGQSNCAASFNTTNATTNNMNGKRSNTCCVLIFDIYLCWIGSLHTMTAVSVVSILSNWSTLCKICNRTQLTYNWFTIFICWLSIIYLWRSFLGITIINVIGSVSIIFNKHEYGHRIISGGNMTCKRYNNHELHSRNLCKDNQNINHSGISDENGDDTSYNDDSDDRDDSEESYHNSNGNKRSKVKKNGVLQICNAFNTIIDKVCLEYTNVRINVNASFRDGVAALVVAIKSGIFPTGQCLIGNIKGNNEQTAYYVQFIMLIICMNGVATLETVETGNNVDTDNELNREKYLTDENIVDESCLIIHLACW